MERPLFGLEMKSRNPLATPVAVLSRRLPARGMRPVQRSVASGEISCYPRIFREARDTPTPALITMTLQRAKGFAAGNAGSPFVAGNGAW